MERYRDEDLWKNQPGAVEINMKRTAIALSLATTLASGTLVAGPAHAQTGALDGGIAIALGNVCASLIAGTQVVPTQSAANAQNWHDAVNQAIELSFDSIKKLFKINAKAKSDPIGGDIALGYQNHALGAISAYAQLAPYTADQALRDHSLGITAEIDAACSAMMATGEVVYPAGYPYSPPTF